MARGAAVVDGSVAYFMNWDGQICSYDSSTHKWSKFRQCPYSYSSLAVIRGLPTVIGGIKGGDMDNKLLSIVNDESQKWVEYFPSMPTKRCDTVAVTTKLHLIVAGGRSGSNQLDIVEVMDIQTRVCLTAASLPHPYSCVSATLCGDHDQLQLYLLGGFDRDDRSRSVLTCSLAKLLQSCCEILIDSVWHRIIDVPVYCSTCAAINGELVAVGGQDTGEHKSAEAVHKYNPNTVSWDIISNIPIARYHCLVAVLPTNEMMVVGGYVSFSNLTDKVEIASIQCIMS